MSADEQRFKKLVDRRAPIIAKMVRSGVERVRRQASAVQIDAALGDSGRDWQAVVALYDFDQMLIHSVRKADEIPPNIDDVILETMRQAGEMTWALDVTDPFVIANAKRIAGDAVTRIDAASRRAIREAITGGVSGDLSRPEVVARVRSSVGLTPQNVTHQANYRAALESVREGRTLPGTVKSRFALGDKRWSAKTLTPARIDKLVDTYAERALTDRATNIARTETIKAANAGRVDSWRQAIADGYLPGSSVMVWRTAEDERVCPQCWPMNGQVVEVVGGPMFESTELGAEGKAQRPRPGPVVQAAYPPLHSRCRCVVVLG